MLRKCTNVFVGLLLLVFCAGFAFTSVHAATAKTAPKKAEAKKAPAKKAAKKKVKSILQEKRGFRFPAFKAKYIQFVPKKRMRLRNLNLAKIVGKKPIVFVYFMVGHKQSETELLAANGLAKIYKGVQFVGITRVRTRKDLKNAYKKLGQLKVNMPVLLDNHKGLLAYVTLTRSVPSYAVVTHDGYLGCSRASSLTELVRPGLKFMDILGKAAKKEKFPFMLASGFSPNPYNLVGKPAPVFNTKLVLGKKTIALKKFCKGSKKPVVLVFWSIGCPHCRAMLPKLDLYAKQNKDKVRILTLVQADVAKRVKEVEKFVKDNKLSCRIFSDAKGAVSKQYHVAMVPTIFLLKPNGSVFTVVKNSRKGIAYALNQALKKYNKK